MTVIKNTHLDGSASIFDRDQRVVAASRDFAALLGYEPEQLVGMHTDEIADPDPERTMRFRVLDAGGTVSGVSSLIAKDGTRVRYAFTAKAVNGGDYYLAAGEPMPAKKKRANGHELARPFETEWLTKAEAATYTHVSQRTLERADAAGELEAAGPAGRRMFKREWLDDWMNRRKG